MSNWVALSEIVRNAALAVAAFVGAYLAWRQLSPAASQARAASTQADLARRAHVTELFNRAVGQLRGPESRNPFGCDLRSPRGSKRLSGLVRPYLELLQAYLRAGNIDYGDEEPPIDIKEIVNVLRSRLEKPDA